MPDEEGDTCIGASTGPADECKTATPGGYVCSGDQLSLVCPTPPPASILQYAPETLAYHGLGDFLGKAFSIGKEI